MGVNLFMLPVSKVLSAALRFFLLVCLFAHLQGCTRGNSENAKPDAEAIARGEKIFTQNCTSCHSEKKDGIGPALGGITAVVNDEWIKKFIKNPKVVVESGDERANMLHSKYKVFMPSFAHYSEQDVNDILAYLHTLKTPPGKSIIDPLALKDPIPEPIAMSDLIMEMKEITTIPPSSKEGQLTRICKLDCRPDTKEMYIVDLRGKLYVLKNNQPKLYLDMVKERPKFIDKPGLATGFGSFAFHPEFAKNGLLYTTHTESPGSGQPDYFYADSIKVMLQWVLTEWQTDKPNGFPFTGKSREILRVNMVHSFHGMQEITFNPLSKPGDEDYGLLYIGIGDGSSVEFGYPFLVHSKEKIWGTIIRIDPSGKNSKNGKYGIPVSNPFATENDPSLVKEIFAYGFRNPHRISWTKSGKILASNIGQHNIESLNMILPGHDYGWPVREGSFVMDLAKGMNNVYPLPADDAKNNITYPVAEYDHGEGNAISGGFEYWGSTIPELNGKYLFGDIVNGRLFFVEMDDLKIGSQAKIREWQVSVNGAVKKLTDLCGDSKVDLRFGRDAQGEIYILTKPDGKVYKLIGRKNS
jgi:glucose/arabinose dehydrogenase/mono/diheme cytochrome c family protein